jgi:hypothetical protein
MKRRNNKLKLKVENLKKTTENRKHELMNLHITRMINDVETPVGIVLQNRSFMCVNPKPNNYNWS